MPGRLEGKIALVIGAGSVGPGWGNGRATAVLFAREGAGVFGVDRSPKALAETATSIDGGVFAPHVADVTQPGEVSALVEACVQRFGRIDVLVNNVGGSAPGDPVSMSEEVWARQLDHNLNYVFHSCKQVVPIMVRQGGGAIVNLASIAALRYFGADVVAYAAAKAGLIHFSRVTAVKYAPHNVRINTVIPGLMNTPLVKVRLAGERAAGDADKLIAARHRQVPMGRMGDGWDVARAVLFLASDEAGYITATELVVDGGLSATCVAPHPDAANGLEPSGVGTRNAFRVIETSV
jgi:NAD(P)-dependent dehydrogenase (short-subunit alcohol dehydrogenase family)